MSGDHSRDVTARLAELEATVRGLTQELVAANERLRQLEAAVEEPPAGSAREGAASAGGDEAIKATPAEPQGTDEAPSDDATADDQPPEEEEASDLDDIIVA